MSYTNEDRQKVNEAIDRIIRANQDPDFVVDNRFIDQVYRNWVHAINEFIHDDSIGKDKVVDLILDGTTTLAANLMMEVVKALSADDAGPSELRDFVRTVIAATAQKVGEATEHHIANLPARPRPVPVA